MNKLTVALVFLMIAVTALATFLLIKIADFLMGF